MTLQEKADKIIFETKVLRELQIKTYIHRNPDLFGRTRAQETKVDNLIKDYCNPSVIIHEEQTSLLEGLR